MQRSAEDGGTWDGLLSLHDSGDEPSAQRTHLESIRFHALAKVVHSYKLDDHALEYLVCVGGRAIVPEAAGDVDVLAEGDCYLLE